MQVWANPCNFSSCILIDITGEPPKTALRRRDGEKLGMRYRVPRLAAGGKHSTWFSAKGPRKLGVSDVCMQRLAHQRELHFAKDCPYETSSAPLKLRLDLSRSNSEDATLTFILSRKTRGQSMWRRHAPHPGANYGKFGALSKRPIEMLGRHL